MMNITQKVMDEFHVDAQGKPIPKPKIRHYTEKRTRIKKGNACHSYPLHVGKGIPAFYIPLIERKKKEEAEMRAEGKVPGAFHALAKELGINEFKFEEDTIDPTHLNHREEMKSVDLDMTAVDRYNTEVLRYRHYLVEECRHLPTAIEMHQEPELLDRLAEICMKLCRNTYYGSATSQKLAEPTIPVLVWLLNRRSFPEDFHCNLHKRITEMCWMALPLKEKFYRSRGVEVLYQNMRITGDSKRLNCWATYALTMIATGSPEIIKEARTMKNIEDLLCELSFEYYWYDWPANFAMVLQGVLYGPNTVTPNEAYFQFL